MYNMSQHCNIVGLVAGDTQRAAVQRARVCSNSGGAGRQIGAGKRQAGRQVQAGKASRRAGRQGNGQAGRRAGWHNHHTYNNNNHQAMNKAPQQQFAPAAAAGLGSSHNVCSTAGRAA